MANALRKQADLHFVSSAVGIENDLIQRAGLPLVAWNRVQGGPLHGVNPLIKLVSLVRLFIGILQSFWLLLWRRPAAVFLTGGWVSIPVAIAAWLYRIPTIIFVPDIEPGRTLKVLGRFARVITATVGDTARYYPAHKQVIETGYPLRSELLTATREAAIEHFGLDANQRTLLVFGGSRGSRALNRAVYTQLDQLMAIPDLQIIHISGKLDAAEVQAAYTKLPAEWQARYHVRDYVHEMGLAFAAADLVLSRAGASTLGELPLFGLPAVLVPLAYEWHYQEVNADWLASQGAAIRLDETEIDKLIPLLKDVLTTPDRLNQMATAARQLACTDGAENIAQIILSQTIKG